MRPWQLILLAVAASLSLAPARSRAEWPTDPAVNLPVCTAAYNQSEISIIADGTGGTIVCWDDGRSGTASEVYAQRIDATGNLLWAANGVRVSAPGVNAWSPVMVSDGAGGAIVAWFDHRNGSNSDVYAQRISPAGAPLWSAGGVTVALQPGQGFLLTMASDAAAGAVCAWANLPPIGPYRSYAQRVNAAGVTPWPGTGGVPLVTRTNAGWNGLVTPDGGGGLICAWADGSGINYETYLQRIDGTGTLRWGANGIALDTTNVTRWRPGIVSDAAGGAVVSWLDYRAGYQSQVYAQRFDSSGTARWAAHGVPCAPTGIYQIADTLLADGAGGVFAAWQDNRVPGVRSIYGQHLDRNGAPQWTSVGVAVDTTADMPFQWQLASDGAGGLLVAWCTGNTVSADIRAQSISAAGNRRWADAGAPVTTAPNTQNWEAVVGDGRGGLVAAWLDGRTDPYGDVYAQRLGPDGSAGNAAVAPSSAPGTLALSAAWPSPARAGETIAWRLALPVGARVRLAILDPAGRRVRQIEDSPRAAGTWTVRWDGHDDAGRVVPAGLYFARLEAAGRSATRKLVVRP